MYDLLYLHNNIISHIMKKCSICKELNRNFIGCDINPKAIEITNARLDAVS